MDNHMVQNLSVTVEPNLTLLFDTLTQAQLFVVQCSKLFDYDIQETEILSGQYRIAVKRCDTGVFIGFVAKSNWQQLAEKYPLRYGHNVV